MKAFYSNAAKRKASTFVSWQPTKRAEQSVAMQRRLFLLLTGLVLAIPSVPAETPAANAVRAMVDAERKFYQTGQEQGTRAAFLAFLADDAIVFQPGPVNGKEAWSKRPESGLDLIWEPTFAAIAGSGDFGYDTGPAKWRAKKTDEKFGGHGHFVSIWKKQKDGSWKVALDCGIEHPEPAGRMEEMRYVERDAPAKSINPEAIGKSLAEAQQKFAETAKIDSDAALREFGADEIRFYRNGHFPLDIAHYATIRHGSVYQTSFETLGGDVSSSADLAYTYGKYSRVRDKRTEEGHYLHIWQTNKAVWKLVLDWQQPLPAEK
jgi:ketosteroid isomerase-like protein